MQEECEICQLDVDLVDQIKQMYQSGHEPDDIGISLGIDFDSIRKHCKSCIKRPRSQQERYRELIEQLEEDLGHARTAMLKRDESPGLSQAYTAMVKEYRNALDKNEELTKPEDIVRDLIIQVVNPMLKETLKGLTEEVSKLRGELIAMGLPKDSVTRVLEEFFKNAAGRLKNTSGMAVNNMNSYFGAVDGPVAKDRSSYKNIQ